MAELGSITLTGKSGREYLFKIYSIDTSFKNVGAVYVYTQAVANGQGGHTHSVIYVGQTGDLGSRLSDQHHKWDCIKGQGANRVCVRVTPNEQERLDIEKDLVANYQPKCNELLKSAQPLSR